MLKNIVKTNNGYVDLSNLAHKGKYIDWNNTDKGCVILFKYNNIRDKLIYLGTNNHCSEIIVLYKGEKHTISRSALTKGLLDRLVNADRYKWCYNIGDIIENEKAKLQIVGRDKKYIIKCLLCGYEFKRHKKVAENKKNDTCPACTNKVLIDGNNDFFSKFPHFKNICDDKQIVIKSNSKHPIKLKCPDCKTISYQSPQQLVRVGYSCPLCNKKSSYGERIIEIILASNDIKYYKEKCFEWAGRRRYDFYIPSLNVIIEVHGNQHYTDHGFSTFGGKSLLEEQENDKLKKELALSNNIKHYIIIDARYSTLKWLKQSIENNQEFNEVFRNIKIEWDDMAFAKNDSLYTTVCNLWNTGYTIKEIVYETNIDRHKVHQMLFESFTRGDTDYNEHEARTRIGFNISSSNCKPIICVDNGYAFASNSILNHVSQSVFGKCITDNNLPRQIRLNKAHFGYRFKYISKDEFNKIKKESPDKAFGGFFI